MKAKKQIFKVVCSISLILGIFVSLLCLYPLISARAGTIAEIVIKVDKGIIKLPGNVEIIKVPVSVARIRSTELRQLNKKYNALVIERLFEVKENTGAAEITGKSQDVLVSLEENSARETVDLSKIYTQKKRKKMQVNEKNLLMASKDIFLIQFKTDVSVDMSRLVKEYKALSVVISAQHVTRTE